MRYLLERLTWKVGTLVVGAALTAGAMAEQHVLATAATAGAMPEQQTHQPPQTTAFNAAMAKIVADVAAQCKKNELQSFYKKTPCLAGDISPDQLADTSRASGDEKVAIQKVRN